MKRSSRRKSDTIRSLILISLTFTLIFSSLVTISSYQEHDNEKAYYTLGADILVKSVNAFDDNIKNKVLALEGVQSATYIRSTSQIVAYGSATYSYIVLGINPLEFAQTAYFDKEYLDRKDPIEYFSRLLSSNQVFMQRDELAKIGGTIGYDLTIVYYKYPYGNLNRTVTVIDTYTALPRFYIEKPREDTTSYRFAILGTYENVAQFASSSYNINGDLLVKVAAGYDISLVKDSIEDELQRGVDCVVDKKETFEGSLRNIMLYGSVNASFISSLIITTTAIILMILIQSLENEREVVTLKILGISPKQLFSMFLTEATSVVIFGSILGAGIGIFAAVMFTDMLTFETQIPATELMIPGVELTFAYLLLFSSAIIAAALTSWIIFRKDTIKAIKQI